MPTSKILIDGVGIDLTADTVDAAHLLSGYTAHDANGAQITGTYSGSSVVEPYIKETLNGAGALISAELHGYTAIRNYMFYNNASMTSISGLDNITSIGRYGFSGCTVLASIALPSSLTTIEASAFSACTALSITSIPASVTTIANSAFKNVKGMTSITFLGTPTSIGSTAFDATVLTDIYVPWSEGAVANAPWGATNATIHYDTAAS